MKVLLDLQAAQTGDTAATEFAKAIASRAALGNVWILLNGAFPETVEPLRAAFENLVPQSQIRLFDAPAPVAANDPKNAWRRQAAEQLREALLAEIAPDIIHCGSMFHGWADDVVMSIGGFERTAPVVVSLFDFPPLNGQSATDREYEKFYFRRLQSLKNADLVFTASTLSCRALVDALHLPPRNAVVISGSWDACAEKALDVFAEIHSLERAVKNTMAPRSPPHVKPRLAFVSPLPPSRSGVSDYSAELLPALAFYYDIEVIPADSGVSSAWIEANFPVQSAEWFGENGASFDRIIYQFGNSTFHDYMIDLLARWPGVVVLHDFFLSDLISGHEVASGDRDLFRCALYESHGYKALLDEHNSGRGAAIANYPMNLQIIEASGGIIVHSRYALAQARHWYNRYIEDFAVIPQLRAPPPAPEILPRQQLNLGEDDFIVIACGFIDPNKMGERLTTAWLASPCADDPRCHLIFVGEYNKGPFGETMRRLVASASGRSKITVTGFVTAEQYEAYQNAADAAVQLRTRSRGETSRAVLDCLAHGIPTIVNANGTMSEIPGDTAIIIPDKFSDQELIGALLLVKSNSAKRAELARNAKAYVAQECNPAHVAALYAEAVEHFFYNHRKFRENRLLCNLARLNQPSNEDIDAISTSIDKNRLKLNRRPLLLYDVSAIARDDLKTGIQRVTRNILCALLETEQRKYRVEPVYDDGEMIRYARNFTLEAIGISNPGLEDEVADIAPGDIFIAVDFDALGIVRNAAKLRAWRAAGVKICFVIYDILPITNPEFFPPGAELPHLEWLEIAVEVADCLACISQTVAGEVRRWVARKAVTRQRALEISWFHLGADIRPSNARPLPETLVSAFGPVPTLLMVGTIEPRKGHLQALAAVELLWSRNIDIHLVIVGGEGWVHLPDRQRRSIPTITRRLHDHPELNKRVFWAKSLSDGELESVYLASTCLLAASEGEGFGLPLIEAAQYGLPLIARDIPVFREVAGNFAFYFDGLSPEALAAAIVNWLELRRAGQAQSTSAMPWISWSESALQLQEIISHDENALCDGVAESRAMKQSNDVPAQLAQ